MKKIESMNEDRWARQVYKACRNSSQWQREVERWKGRGGMEAGWQEMGVKEIKSKIEENGHQEWRNGVEGKSTLRWYRGKERIGREDWYQGDWASKLLFKARSGTLEVNARNRDKNEQQCRLCGEVKETVEHFIIECDTYRTQRQLLDRQVAEILGREEWEERKELEDRGIRTVLGLTGDKDCDNKIVSHMKTFLAKSWSLRKSYSSM